MNYTLIFKLYLKIDPIDKLCSKAKTGQFSCNLSISIIANKIASVQARAHSRINACQAAHSDRNLQTVKF